MGNTVTLSREFETVHSGLAAESRKLADTEGITVAAAVEKLTKNMAEKDDE